MPVTNFLSPNLAKFPLDDNFDLSWTLALRETPKKGFEKEKKLFQEFKTKYDFPSLIRFRLLS